jgi:NAD(P)H-hydrate repair Nnr-like enzyme with NAD(P)H-hydrate dehydratase domain
VIAGLAAQGLGPREAAAAGVVIAGEAALHAVVSAGTLSLTASDVVAALPKVIRALYDPQWSPERVVSAIEEN